MFYAVKTNAFAFYEAGNIKLPKAVEFCDEKYSHKHKCSK
jgi:hypothetical protein